MGRRGRLQVFGPFLMIILCTSPAFAGKLGMVTGGPKGTYYQFGLNLQELMKTRGYELEVFHSTGSVENVYAVFKRPGVQLGIVQSDVLAFVAKVQTNPALKRIAQKIKMVFPLYNEEIHLVGRNDINDFDDLEGKRVAIDKEGSGTYLTAKLLFEISQVKPAELVPVGTEEALERIKAGTLDAMFYVAGYPVRLFKENVKAEDKLKLIPITNKNVVAFYPQAVIPAGTYDWHKEEVPTAAVKAVLITYDYRFRQCGEVGQFAKILYENQDWLRQHGHPKWKNVDLSYELKGWEQYDCVRRELGTVKPVELPKSKDVNPVLEAIKELL
uniref:TAXI family TRAP transporter solute-binding subunit n=1 Tax=Desulfacinum infernum TaxID=35837 RepID=A0A832A5U0_9BACT